MRAVDTNVLVRLITRDDPRQAKVAESFVSRGAWVSHLVLAEAVWVLSSVYRLDAPGVATAIDMLLSHKNLSLQESEVVESALARYRERPSIGFSDCLVLETARKAGHTPIGTFDKVLGKLDGAHRL
jgi:predicted nucleic-acid-binding protein